MSEERLKEVNIYSFNDENYVSLQDYTKIQRRIDKAIKYINETWWYEGYYEEDITYLKDEYGIDKLLSILKGEGR